MASEPCVLWEGAVTLNGYGLVNCKHEGKWKNFYVHRLACEFANGPPPPGKNDAMHSCDVRNCYEPSHLSWGSRGDNMRDAKRKGRTQRGSGHWNAKLTEARVAELRRKKASGIHRGELAVEFGVHVTTVNALCREGWEHING